MNLLPPIVSMILAVSVNAAAVACGEAETCSVALGSYQYEAPIDQTDPLPVVIYFHGYGSSAANTINVDRVLVETAVGRGYVFVALEGMTRSFEGAKNGWSVRDGQEPLRNEADFARAVLDDLGNHLPIDNARVLLAGYSMGGSAALDTACHSPGGFAGFSILNGAMWNPLPQACTGPVRLLHTHAFSDEVMPLEGLNYGAVSTGDVFAGLALIRDVTLNDHTPDGFEISEAYSCRQWADSTIRFCLYQGSHIWPESWMSVSLDWFETWQD